jgi:hypothetical protein
LGRRLSLGDSPHFDIEIVGLVKDLRYGHLREGAPDRIFFPLAQILSDEADSPRRPARFIRERSRCSFAFGQVAA